MIIHQLDAGVQLCYCTPSSTAAAAYSLLDKEKQMAKTHRLNHSLSQSTLAILISAALCGATGARITSSSL